MGILKRTTMVACAALVVTATTVGRTEPIKSAVPAKPDDRTIVHVLNRLGFGPAPGDLERVRRTGLQSYIDQQLQPGRIDDNALRARLATFETLTRSTQEMAERYYLPWQSARREQQRAQAAQGPAMAPQNDQRRRDTATPEQNESIRMERQAIGEVMQAKVLRAVYSERQLEEVMVDFWFNHFNVFVG